VTEWLHYSILVQWSEHDQAYLVTLPEWEGRVFNPVSHGHTYEDAIKQGHDALAALVASARQHNQRLPEPQVIVRTI
jgi:antitoxin HicB